MHSVLRVVFALTVSKDIDQQTQWDDNTNICSHVILLLLLLQSALQPLVGFGLLYDFVPQSSIFTLLSPVSHFHLL